MEDLLLELLNGLEAIGDRDESLYDTVVRDKMGNAIFFGFVKPQSEFVLPDHYGMPEAADQEIKLVLGTYIAGAQKLATVTGLNTFHKRLAAFQNSTICTAKQRQSFDDFFGWSNPELFDEAGNVTRLY